MSVFRNIRIFPQHGTRSVTVTWSLVDGTPPGDIYVAFSTTGTKWQLRNPDAPVASGVGNYEDSLFLNSGGVVGYYRLLLVAGGADYFSENVAICGDLTPREYGMIRGILHREFTEMRVANGYPVWHCIPLDYGEPADGTDPDTGEYPSVECAEASPENSSYGMKFRGGFYPPILTWMRPMSVDRGTLKDSENDTAVQETDSIGARLLAWPRPSRGHMIVDPATDRRYLVGDEIKTFTLRGVYPVAYEVTLEFLTQGDQRYRFPMPEFDARTYRKIP